MKYAEYQEKMRPGLVFGDGVRSYTLETVTPDLTILRGTSRARRQESSLSQGSKRAIPTEVILDVVSAIESGRIGPDDIMRTAIAAKGLPPLFEHLGLDHDPFILGYDSTIRKVCDFLLSGIIGDSTQFSDPREGIAVSHRLPKPFLLLAGISGTGKTQWVRDREVAGKRNVCIIPVRPDWHEPSDLLGYFSRIGEAPVYVLPTEFLRFVIRGWRDAWLVEKTLTPRSDSLTAMTPFWLCLDEMNLAPVEQYFADYLSVLEGRRWTEGQYECPPLLALGVCRTCGFDSDRGSRDDRSAEEGGP